MKVIKQNKGDRACLLAAYCAANGKGQKDYNALVADYGVPNSVPAQLRRLRRTNLKGTNLLAAYAHMLRKNKSSFPLSKLQTPSRKIAAC